MISRRNFLRGILGSVLAAPLLGVAKAFGYRKPTLFERIEKLAWDHYKAVRPIAWNFDYGNLEWVRFAQLDGATEAWFDCRVDGRKYAMLLNPGSQSYVENKVLVIGEKPEPQMWFMSAVQDPTDWSYTGV